MEYKAHYNSVEFGKRLRDIRRKNKHTQEALAEKLMLSVDSISNYENGKTTCMPEHITHLCQIFNVSADYFYFGINKELDIPVNELDSKINSLLISISEMDKPLVYNLLERLTKQIVA